MSCCVSVLGQTVLLPCKVVVFKHCSENLKHILTLLNYFLNAIYGGRYMYEILHIDF
jgi:hypothetical protein